VEQPSRTQQLWLWVAAAVIGLTVGAIVHASYIGEIGLVAAAGIVLGVGFAASTRRKRD
jgi:hypothetical protein